MKEQNSHVSDMKKENEDMITKLNALTKDFNTANDENKQLLDELSRQQTLYNELKKMRGRGEEMDMIQDAQHVRFQKIPYFFGNYNYFAL